MAEQKKPTELRIKWSDIKADKDGKKEIQYYNDIDIPSFEDVKEYYEAQHECDEEPAEPLVDNSKEYWDTITNMNETDADDLESNLPYSPIFGKMVLIHGYFGGWRVQQEGGRVVEFKGRDTLTYPFANHIDKVKIFIDRDGLHAQNCHHDGTDFYSFYVLTEKGLRYWRNNGHSDPQEQDDFDHDVHKHLLGTKGYVRKVNFYLY